MNFSKTEELTMNTKSQHSIMSANKAIRRIQKVIGAITRLWKIWHAHHIHKETKIKLFNVYVKSLILYGCQTWLITCEIQRILQSFVNRCLRNNMKIWLSRVISDEKLREMTG
jgi:hypothetical protein